MQRSKIDIWVGLFVMLGAAALLFLALQAGNLLTVAPRDAYQVRAEFEQRYEYKNAVNEFTQSDYTGPHREAMLAWMTSIYDSALANAAFDRKVEAPALKATIEAGPYSAAQALQLQLDVYTQHHLAAKHQRPPDLGSAAHQQLRALLGVQGLGPDRRLDREGMAVNAAIDAAFGLVGEMVSGVERRLFGDLEDGH